MVYMTQEVLINLSRQTLWMDTSTSFQISFDKWLSFRAHTSSSGEIPSLAQPQPLLPCLITLPMFKQSGDLIDYSQITHPGTLK